MPRKLDMFVPRTYKKNKPVARLGLYFITPKPAVRDSLEYGSYQSAVVVAASAEDARKVHPDGMTRVCHFTMDWCKRAEDVEALRLGDLDTATNFRAGDVVCASKSEV